MKQFLRPIIDCSLEESETFLIRVVEDSMSHSKIKIHGNDGILYQLKNGDTVVLMSEGTRVILYQVVFNER